jgi:hypothetical protein
LKEHSKEDLNALFINVIKGMSENESWIYWYKSY